MREKTVIGKLLLLQISSSPTKYGEPDGEICVKQQYSDKLSEQESINRVIVLPRKSPLHVCIGQRGTFQKGSRRASPSAWAWISLRLLAYSCRARHSTQRIIKGFSQNHQEPCGEL
ncbi:MAG: hypothetical protein NXY59_09645 [Aigarchaeota archaeon]|nr:hypothetical protein [Candidatus Pelearchaeum maunauluense]